MKKVLNIAHRGAKGYFPENTIIAFKNAIKMGVDGIELDVHLSKDGEITVIHDDTVDRTTNGFGKINELSATEIKTFWIQNEHKIPTLSEVFEVVNRQCFINIEIKCFDCVEKVVDLISLYVNEKKWAFSDFLISSFDWKALQAVHILNVNIPIGVLIADDIDNAISFAVAVKAYSIHPHFELLTETICTKIHAHNLLNFTWTINTKEAIEKTRNLNIDGIITDFPDRIMLQKL